MRMQKTRKSKNKSNIHEKNDFFKTTKSQRHSNYYGFRKSRVAKVRVHLCGLDVFFREHGRFWLPKWSQLGARGEAKITLYAASWPRKQKNETKKAM